MRQMKSVKDFAGYVIYSGDKTCEKLNGKTVEKTIKKVFPQDIGSTLYLVKVTGVQGYQQLYENEMYAPS